MHPRSSGYSPFEILYERPAPVIEKLKGDHHQLADLEMSRHFQAREKSAISPEKPKKGHPFLWAIGFIPISQEMSYGLKIRKKKKKNPLQPVWTGPHMVVLQPLLLLKLQVSSLGSTTPESRRQ